MSTYSVLHGTTKDEFHLSTGDLKLINNSGVLEIQDALGNNVKIRIAGIPATGQDLSDVPVYADTKDIAASITSGFDGGSAPAAGTNSGKYLFCHTSGSSYTAGEVWYDNGVSLVKRANIRFIVTQSAISGTVSLSANGIYSLEGGTWTLKGDGTVSGVFRPIKIDFDYQDTTVTSSASIPDGAHIKDRRLHITTAFDTAAAVTVATDGTSPLTLINSGTDGFDIEAANEYINSAGLAVSTDEGGHVEITVTPNGATQGAGYVLVYYDTPQS